MEATKISSLEIEISSSSSNASRDLDSLASSLQKLKASSNVTKQVNALKKLTSALNDLSKSTSSLKNLTELTTALSSLSSVSTKGFNSTINAIGKIPKIMDSLDSSKIKEFSSRMNELSIALTPLSTKMATISSGFHSINRYSRNAKGGLDSFNVSQEKVNTKSHTLSNTLSKLKTSFVAFTLIVNGVTNKISGFIDKANSYIENLNLFEVSMGSFYDEAMEYAELVGGKMGIDVSEWIEAQGTFANIAKGFGFTTEQAYKLSKGLTEISYDLASFKNMNIETAFLKVRSGLAGELEPLRNVGYALDQATLQQVAYAHGVNLSYQSMTQSQKAMLRYTAIVEQSYAMGVTFTNGMGDMAKTLDSPANAIRRLKASFSTLSREIGNVFLPLIAKVVPYIHALTNVVTQAVKSLVNLIGFSYKQNSTENVFDGMSSSIEDATENAKELMNITMGFDELNTINKSSGASSGNGYASDLGINIEDVWDKNVISQITSEVDILTAKFNDLFNKFKDPLKVISFSNIISALGNLNNALKPFTKGLGDGLWWLYNNVLVPLAEFTIETAIPTFINILADSLKSLQGNLDTFGGWLSSNLSSIVGLTATIVSLVAIGSNIGAITGVFTSLVNTVEVFFGILSGNQASMSAFTFMFPNIAKVINMALSPMTLLSNSLKLLLSPMTLLVGAISIVIGAFVQLYAQSETFRNSVNNLISVIGNTFIKVFQDLWSVVLSCKDLFVGLWNDALYPLWNSIVTLLEPVFHVLISTLTMLWNTVLDPLVQFISGVFSQAWNSIVSIIVNGLLPVFHDVINIVTPIVESFMWLVATLWDSVLVAFSDVFSSVGSTIKLFEELFSLAFKIVENVLVGILDFIHKVFTGDWKGALDSIKGIFNKTWEDIKDFGSNMIDWFKDLGKNLVDGLKNGITNSMGKLKESITDMGKGVINWFKDTLGIHSPSKEMKDNGAYTIDGLINGIKEKTTLALKTITNLGNDLIKSFKNLFNENIMKKISSDSMNSFANTTINLFNAFKNRFDNLLSSFITNVNSSITKFITNVNSSITQFMSSINLSISQFMNGVNLFITQFITSINSHISNFVYSVLQSLNKMIEDISSLTNKGLTNFSSIWKSCMNLTESYVQSGMGTISSAVSSVVESVSSKVGNMLSKISSAISSAKSSLSSLNSMSSSAQSASKSIASSVSSAKKSLQDLEKAKEKVSSTNSKVKAYASGGVVTTGQMFIARERGAELVGNIGNTTTVMNNDQIVQAVSSGVAQAVSSVLASQDNSQNVVINLDGEVIYKNQKKVSKRLGYNLGI